MDFLAVPVENDWGEITYQPTAAGITAMVLAMAALLVLACFLTGRRRVSTKQIAFSSLAMALGTVLSMVKVIHMPMGGSVTLLSMLVISLIGYWYGLGAGIMTAVAYGILQMLIDPYIISIPQMLIDYIFAYGALGLSGLFSRSRHGLAKGYLAAVLGRYFFAVLSGWIFFGMYAADYGFDSALLYSLAYNGAYIGLEAILTLAVISISSVKFALANIRQMALER